MKPCTKRVLRALELAGETGATNRVLLAPYVGGNRFGARLAELRDVGYEIECRREGAGKSRYYLRGSPSASGGFTSANLDLTNPPPGVKGLVCRFVPGGWPKWTWVA